MRPLAIVGTSLLFAACPAPEATVAEGEPCEEDGATSCATDRLDDVAGYVCVDAAWTADPDCECRDDQVYCVDTAIGFTGVDRAGARPVATRRLRLA